MTKIYNSIENIDQIFIENNLMISFTKTIGVFFVLTAPILFTAFIVALAINYLQVGFFCLLRNL